MTADTLRRVLTLAMDTATSNVTVAVARDDVVLADVSIAGSRQHGEALAPAIAGVLAEAEVATRDLSAIAVGVGPGPFTGLRVGLMTARTLGLALGVPVFGVCSLDVIAAEAVRRGLDERFLVATDAKRKEVYWATYDGSDGGVRVDGPQVSRPLDIAWSGPVVGEGATLYADSFPDGREPMFPSAAALCHWVAEGRPTLEPLPLYLRRPDAAEPGARKQVSEPGRR